MARTVETHPIWRISPELHFIAGLREAPVTAEGCWRGR
jgi:hypothetical protein